MSSLLRTAFLQGNRFVYQLIRPILFRRSAQQTHEDILKLLKLLDGIPGAQSMLRAVNRLAFPQKEVTAGGVRLSHPFILAAGFVKGTGFADEAAAQEAVERGENIIPGWRTMPALVGAVEFGSFTRWPRLGNPGTVIWRDKSTRSTQNRVGLKNPGVKAAAAFLARHKQDLPETFGINIAVSPGVTNPEQEKRDVLESLDAFVAQRVFPAWFTLNLSCPNTEDDPGNHQTEGNTRELCGAVIEYLQSVGVKTGRAIPLWVKISPSLAESQYAVLMRVFEETGVRAVVATNTLPQPVPGQPNLNAGVGGGALHHQAVCTVALLAQEKQKHHYGMDIIGCGGIQDKITYQPFIRHNVQVVQYWTALVYRGPLAAAMILDERL